MKPSANELKKALVKAEDMRVNDDDPDALAKTLLYLYQRVEKLDLVYDAASHYVNFGQEEHEHADLVHALEEAREQESAAYADDKHDFGL